MIHSYKALSSQRVTHKRKKNMRHGEFRVSSTIDEQVQAPRCIDALFQVSSSR